MKNHWLKLFERKKRRFWTAEFSRNGLFVLRPRRVIITDNLSGLRPIHTVEMTFRGAMVANDPELGDFISESCKSMAGWLGRLRHYNDMLDELEYFEATDLSYGNIGVADDVKDIKFIFAYNIMRHIRH